MFRTSSLPLEPFSQVDAVGAASSTPALAQLQKYDAVLVWSTAFGFDNAAALGDNLADYRVAGGRVVVAVFATADKPLQGRCASGGYNLINPT